ncbi:C-terminal binding protein [Salinactinospora qingdaonensis]|uniref:C-terminal binding protein n=1 Tax=Salinactinospora qingdaonensis TaxID=702744 RepID=A0ABP7GH88_9ACTN
MSFRVVVTDQVFPDVDTERELLAQAGGELVVAHGDRDEVLATAREADGLLNTFFGLDAADIESLTKCKVIARYGIGVDNIDLDAARAAGIQVSNVPDYCVEEVATHTVAMALALLRRVPEGDALVRAGGWGVRSLGEIRRVSNTTVGFLGYGRIARQVATTLRGLGADVVVHDPYLAPDQSSERIVDLDTLLAEADLVCVHCPLTPQTRGLIDARALARMRRGSYLVNTSRGPIVVLDDLTAALREGHLAGAALDVFETEPPPTERLIDVPNLLMTPHSAFFSREAIRESQRKAATQVIKALRGEELDYRVA